MSINDEMTEKSCSYCGETIPLDSHRCKFCGSIFKNMQTDSDDYRDGEYSDCIHKDSVIKDSMLKDNIFREENALSNGFKVFIAVLYTLIPGLGQIAGIIHGITMVNSKGKDKRSFGKALIVAMVLVFMIYCVILYISAVAIITLYYYSKG